MIKSIKNLWFWNCSDFLQKLRTFSAMVLWSWLYESFYWSLTDLDPCLIIIVVSQSWWSVYLQTQIVGTFVVVITTTSKEVIFQRNLFMLNTILFWLVTLLKTVYERLLHTCIRCEEKYWINKSRRTYRCDLKFANPAIFAIP